MNRLLCLFLAIPAALPLQASPLPVEIKNPSFEENAATLVPNSGSLTTNVIPQWTASGSGLFRPNTPVNFAPDGVAVVLINSGGNMSQALMYPGGAAVTASAGARLVVNMQARPRSIGGAATLTLDVRVAGASVLAAPGIISLAANDTGYSTVNGSATLSTSLGAANGQPLTLVISSTGDQANVDTLSGTIAFPPAINSLTVSPSPAIPGQPATISWNVTGAVTLSLNGMDVTGQTSAAITVPAAPATYTLSATNGDGTSTRDVLVDPLPAALPAAAVRINEVMSENATSLMDEDGTHQDWIELYNTTAGSVNLAGWHLTDDRTQPAKWTFPAVSLPSGGYLVVFASGKNRTSNPLHTNFKLDNDGEYLALTNAAGQTISAFSPLPRLAPNQSYGPGNGPSRNIVSISPDNSAMKWLVPGAAVSDDWRGGAPFDESGWPNGMWDLGYNTTTTIAYGIAAGTVGGQTFNGVLGMDFDVTRPVIVTDLACFDSSSNGLSQTITVQLWSRNQNGTPSSTADDTGIAVLTSDTFSSAAPGTLVGGQRFKPLPSPLTLNPGSYTIVAYNYGGTEPNGNNSAFNSGTNSSDGALQFVGTSRYGTTQGAFPGTPDGGPAERYGAGSFRFRESAAFATSAESAMLNVNASVLTRTPFTIAGPALQCPALSVTYDDGFVAWINGVEVARRNAPAALTFNSAATATQFATTAVNLNGFASAFHAGTNIFAVQGLNAAASDADFRLRASLSAEGSSETRVFLTTPTPGAPNSSGLLAAHPVINEIHSDPVDSKSRSTEFVELYNPLSTDLNIGNWQLTGGVLFTIPAGTVIPACGYLIVGENPAHIQTWLGYSDALGPWTGSLKNEGDEVVLRDSAGHAVDRVPYELGFPWPSVGDDPGDSMQRLNEALDGTLGASWRSALPTPGARNSVTTGDAPPAIRQVNHTPEAPLSGQAVTITAKVTDPDGLAAVRLEYQIVEPGNYIRLTDAAWSTAWNTLAMHDDGLNGDTAANDDNFTAVIPAAVQTHRRLIRYRIRSWDGALNYVRVPYAGDDCPNFAYFCYDGVPAWSGAVRPGVTAVDTFSTATMRKVRAWHLLSQPGDVQNCQYSAAFNDGSYRFEGALVIDGKVYDHIHYRVKGQNSTFNTGKNKWKLKFNRGQHLEMPDDYGLTKTTVKTLNISSIPAPWAPWNRGLAGLDEAMAFRLSNLAGAPAPLTSYLELRVIDGALEQNPSNQFDGDLWGLYLAFENTDNNFKDEHGLPDGNIFRMQGAGAGNSVLGQGKGQPGDLSDLNAFLSTASGYNKGGGSTSVAPLVTNIQTEAWFRANVNLPAYFNWRSVTEAINQTDRRDQENVVYFRNPADGRWQIIPWDCDLLYERFDRWGPQATQNANNFIQYEQIARGLLHPAILTDFQNRARELQDLLLNSDQAWKVVDEFISIISDESPRIIPNGDVIADGFVEVERRRWDYNPVNPTPPRGAGPVGNYYKTPYPIGNQGNGPFPQPYNRVLPSGDFEGMVKWVKDFIATDAHGGGRLAKMATGEINPFTLAATAAIQIPATPVITYAGPADYPLNQLSFTSSAFNSPNAQTFAAIQWRVGMVDDPSVPGFTAGQPWKYEIENLWTSAELATFTATQAFPAAPLAEGKTYRGRVRHKDSAGRWSHWSEPVQFTAGTAVPGNLATDLVISEVMYNPPEGNSLEFIELMNINQGAPLDISGVTFTAGVTFSFLSGTVVLAPGERAVIVGDTAAFTAKYGAGPRILGTFSGNLSNGGEQLVVSLGQTTALRDFTYLDSLPWPAAADGDGASLVLIAPLTNPVHSNAMNWRASLPPNPGGTDAISYNEWKIAHSISSDDADPDQDGLTSLTEYFLGSDPATPSLSSLPAATLQPDGSISLTITRAITADDAAWLIETASDLTTWNPASVALTARTEFAGTESLTFTIPVDPGRVRRFLRVRIFTR